MIKFLYKKNKDVYNFAIIKKRYIIELSTTHHLTPDGVWSGGVQKP